jgi:membrane associated rhomboid family serine protease
MAWVVLSALLCVGAVVVTAISAESRGALSASPVASALDWQPALGLREPWRLWTCAWVHWSAAHLAVNAAGAIVVAFVGWRARLPALATAAWFVAWPLTQVLMACADPERLAAVMPHYFGLSGVLHAGVVVLGLTLALPRPPGLARPRAARASGTEASHITEGPWAMTEVGTATALPGSTLESPPEPFDADERTSRERWIGVAIVAGTLAKVVLEAPWELAPRPSAALGIAVAPIAHACGIGAGVVAWGAVRALHRRRR